MNRRLHWAHSLGLSLVAGLIGLGYLLTVQSLDDQADDSKTINVAGRQRMLSQKIAKLCREILDENPAARVAIQSELRETCELWSTSHDWLMQESTTVAEVAPIKTELARIGHRLNHIVIITEPFLADEFSDPDLLNRRLSELATAERQFLDHMHETVNDLEHHATSKVERLGQRESAILIAVILCLILEVIYFFRPLNRLVRLKILDQNRRLRQAERSRQRAVESECTKTAFLTKISHELRTPLNGIAGSTQLLLADKSLSEDCHALSQLIERANDRMIKHVEDLILWSQLEAHDLELRDEEIDFGSLVQESLRPAQELAVSKGLEFRLRGLDAFGRLCSDRILIGRCLAESAFNAAKFTELGFVAVDLCCEEREARQLLRITVSDSGPGFDAKTSQATMAFRQREDGLSRQHEGLGLGLCTIKALLDLAGGDLQIREQETGGAVISLLVPVTSIEDGCNTSTEIEVADLRHQDVLIVEDNPVNSLLLRRILEATGAHVQVAENGSKALDAREERPWDLILMDLQMPVMDGFEATLKLREFGIQAPIIALTANDLQDERERATAVGMNAFLTKPLKPQDLYRVLARLADDAH